MPGPAHVDRIVDGKSIKLKDLLEQLGQCRIPLFQRGYSWELEHVTALLNDEWQACITERPPRAVFLGTLVTQAFGQNDILKNIIDGQQRLTTINLVMVALREMCVLGSSVTGTNKFDRKLLISLVSLTAKCGIEETSACQFTQQVTQTYMCAGSRSFPR